MIDLASGPSAISVAATAVGALSGALFAVERRFGLSGVFCLAFSTGVSGSIMRDVLLQSGPSVILTDVEFLLAVLICATTGFFFSTAIRWVHPLLVVFDALSIGFFAVLGATKGVHAGLGPLGAVLIGTVNAIGGWVLRDILAGDRPATRDARADLRHCRGHSEHALCAPGGRRALHRSLRCLDHHRCRLLDTDGRAALRMERSDSHRFDAAHAAFEIQGISPLTAPS